MGTFREPIEVGDQAQERLEWLEALVDTGATYTVVPTRDRDVRLGLRFAGALASTPTR